VAPICGCRKSSFSAIAAVKRSTNARADQAAFPTLLDASKCVGSIPAMPHPASVPTASASSSCLGLTAVDRATAHASAWLPGLVCICVCQMSGSGRLGRGSTGRKPVQHQQPPTLSQRGLGRLVAGRARRDVVRPRRRALRQQPLRRLGGLCGRVGGGGRHQLLGLEGGAQRLSEIGEGRYERMTRAVASRTEELWQDRQRLQGQRLPIERLLLQACPSVQRMVNSVSAAPRKSRRRRRS